MKKLALILSVFSLSILSSCDLFDKVDDVNFDIQLKQTFVVDAPAGVTAYSATQVLDGTADPEIVKYKSKLQSFTVSKVTYTITEYNGKGSTSAITFTDGKFSIASSSTTIATLASVDLQASNGGAEKELTINQSGLDELAGLLLSTQKATVKAEGKLSKVPVYFKINAVFYVTVKADAL